MPGGLLDGDRCWWLAADFAGQDALTEALMYVKAGRALGVPVALEVSRSGVGMHAWVFFTAPVPAGLRGGWAPACCVRRWRFAGR